MPYLPCDLSADLVAANDPGIANDGTNDERNTSHHGDDDTDYEDDDDYNDDDEISDVDSQPDENEIRLAHRTSQIMNDYRAYLTEMTGQPIKATPVPAPLPSASSKRTQIMNEYRAYLSETTGQALGDYGNCENYGIRGFIMDTDEEEDAMLHDNESLEDDATYDIDEEGGGRMHRSTTTRFKRVWTYNQDAMHDVPFGSSFSSVHGSNGSVASSFHHNYAAHSSRSKRLKRGVMGVLVACAIIGSVVGITNAAANRNKRNGNPSSEALPSMSSTSYLEQKVAEAMKEEQEREDALPHAPLQGATSNTNNSDQDNGTKYDAPAAIDALPHHVIMPTADEEGLQRPPKSKAEMKETPPEFEMVTIDETSPSSAEEMIQDAIQEGQAASNTVEVTNNTMESIPPPPLPSLSSLPSTMSHYESIGIKYKPTWYDRTTGWSGTTYIDALTFCATKDSNIPCPYEAYCPMGPLSTPTGGHKDERGTGGDGLTWAPIMDSANGWVQVSSKNACVKYNTMNVQPPLWGLTGEGSEEMTRHVMCCQELEMGIDVVGDLEESSDSDSNNTQEVVVVVGYDEATATSTVAKHRPAPPTNTNSEQLVMDTMHPVWFGRDDGYKGTTHNDASIFCNRIAGLHLCPIEAYCPNGVGFSQPLFLKKDAFEGEQWAPVGAYVADSRSENNWVLIGTLNDDAESTCITYDELNGQGPIWGLDGTKTAIKEHVMCCADPTHVKTQTSYLKNLNPEWLDESKGWDGGSHDDATQACASVNKKLCPYAAYCPHGPGKPVGGYHATDFNAEGEQWAPVFDNGNGKHWIQIGQKHKNVLTTCLSGNELGGGSLDGGISKRKKHVKRHVMCCDY